MWKRGDLENFFRLLRAARDTFFFTHTARSTKNDTALCSY